MRQIRPSSLFAVPCLAAAWMALGSLAGSAGHPEVTRGPGETLAKYGSTPKGVTLEGAGHGLPPIQDIRYEAVTNRFLFNGGSAYYQPPVPRQDLVAIFGALAENGLLGVTLRPNQDFLVFGRLSKASNAAQSLAAADRILGGIVLGTTENLRGVALPRGFRPATLRGRRTIQPAVRLNLTNYAFGLDPASHAVRRIGFQPSLTLTPVRVDPNGRHQPDEDLLRRGIHGEREDVENFQYLSGHIFEFLEIPQFQRAVLLGEAAAFARYLAAQGQSLAELARQM